MAIQAELLVDASGAAWRILELVEEAIGDPQLARATLGVGVWLRKVSASFTVSGGLFACELTFDVLAGLNDRIRLPRSSLDGLDHLKVPPLLGHYPVHSADADHGAVVPGDQVLAGARVHADPYALDAPCGQLLAAFLGLPRRGRALEREFTEHTLSELDDDPSVVPPGEAPPRGQPVVAYREARQQDRGVAQEPLHDRQCWVDVLLHVGLEAQQQASRLADDVLHGLFRGAVALRIVFRGIHRDRAMRS